MKLAPIVSLLSVLLPLLCPGQQWAPAGATWHYSYGFYSPASNGYFKMEVDTDTTIKGYTYKTLKRGTAPGKLFIRNEGGQVYQYDARADSSYKIFDFDADSGASWVLTLPFDGEVDSIRVSTYYKDSVIINGKSSRRIYAYFEHIGKTENYRVPDFETEIIEFIGSTYTDFLPWRRNFSDGPGIGLRCYNDSYFGFKQFGNTPCEAGIDDNPNDRNFTIFPNPAYSSFTLQFQTPPGVLPVIKIYEATGKECAAIEWNNMAQPISTSSLKPGLYLVKVGSHTEKLLIR